MRDQFIGRGGLITVLVFFDEVVDGGSGKKLEKTQLQFMGSQCHYLRERFFDMFQGFSGQAENQVAMKMNAVLLHQLPDSCKKFLVVLFSLNGFLNGFSGCLNANLKLKHSRGHRFQEVQDFRG